MKMPSPMKGGHAFSMVPKAEIQRSTFDRSHGYKTTFDAGYLIPVYVDEALPGDTFNLQMSGFARLTTPIKPIMDNLYLDTFFFAVPYRLVWTNWQKFNGEQVNPGDSTSFVIPQFTAHIPTVGSLSDYMGLPPVGTAVVNYQYSSLWHRAYNLIYNQWFRDENLINSATVDTGDGPDNIANYVLRRRGKRHDYFTSCLPWPQKGTAVSLPLGTTAPVIRQSATAFPQFIGSTSAKVNTKFSAAATANPTATQVDSGGAGNWTANEALYWNSGATATGLMADLTAATAATINQLRQAFQIQKLLERDARGGTRYTEIVRAHFGVTSPDARLQRPEYLGGGSSPVIISPIAQTSNTPVSGTPQANLSGIGTSSFQGHGFTKSFTEHCLLIGLASVRADLTYQTGTDRMFSRSTRYDFYWPALSHIGEQAVLQKEIFTVGDASDNTVFGYQERYAEYRYKPSKITGLFRSLSAGTLDIWHLSQKFTSAPVLGQTFIEENPPISRVVAVTTEPAFYFDSWFKLICARPMPVFGVPGLIDHF